MSRYSRFLIPSLFLITAVFIVFFINKVFDFDSLYHLRHAWLYQTEGLFFSVFPWTSASIISTLQTDLWYGFHILLIPFTYFPDLLFGLKLATAISASVALASFFYLLRFLKVRWPLFWTLLLLFSTGDSLFRIFMVRPHILSLFASLLLLAWLIRPHLWAVFVVSIFISFIHLSLVWVPLLIVFIVCLAKLFHLGKLDWRAPLVVIGGLALGWLLRPHPLPAIKLAYIQIVDIILVKMNDIPIKFGRELNTLTSFDIWLQYTPLLFLAITVAGLTIWLIRRQAWSDFSDSTKVAITSSGLLSFIFLILSFTTARRSTDFLSGFLILFFALMVSSILSSPKLKRFFNYELVLFLLGTLLLFMLLNSTWVVSSFIRNTPSVTKFQEAAVWLKDNTNKGDIVFNAYWDNFPNLFFWNTHNYYINGMDPIFSYRFSESLYWQNYFIAYGGQPFTCPIIRCLPEQVQDIHSVLLNDFRASYIIVEQRRSPNLYSHLSESTNFEAVFSTPTETVFKILPPVSL